MITLSTQIPQLLFSSAIPDLAIITDGDGEVEIALTSDGSEVFIASYFPYNRQIKVFDLRSVVEMYMRENDSSLMDFAISATASSVTHQLCLFKVVYLEHRFDGDIAEFLRNNFLTNTSSKRTSEKAVEHLHFFLDAGEQTSIRYFRIVRFLLIPVDFLRFMLSGRMKFVSGWVLRQSSSLLPHSSCFPAFCVFYHNRHCKGKHPLDLRQNAEMGPASSGKPAWDRSP